MNADSVFWKCSLRKQLMKVPGLRLRLGMGKRQPMSEPKADANREHEAEEGGKRAGEDTKQGLARETRPSLGASGAAGAPRRGHV